MSEFGDLQVTPAVAGALSSSGWSAAGLRVAAGESLARAVRRLRERALDVLMTTPDAALALHERAALKVEELRAVVLGWPELFGGDEALTALMTDFPKDGQRVVYTSDPARIADLVERYARKALTVGGPVPDAPPASPVGPVRTVSASWAERGAALRGLIEVLDPASAIVWAATQAGIRAATAALPGVDTSLVITSSLPDDGVADVAIAFDLPTLDQLRALTRAGREVVLLVPPLGAAYVARITSAQRPVQLPGAADELGAALARRRGDVARVLAAGVPERGLLALAPLFERYDAALVAAALYELWSAGTTARPRAARIEVEAETAAAAGGPTAKVWVDLGRRDGATPADFVAALTKDLRVPKDAIGRIELRDGFSLVELPAADAERIASQMSGLTIRRKRISARLDRDSGWTERREGGRPGKAARGPSLGHGPTR